MFDKATKKRTIIILVYLAIITLLSLAIYWIRKPAPSCFDHMKNQGETGIDCGGPCGLCTDVTATQDLQVQEKAFVSDGNNQFDLVANVSNPNNSVGASSFDYTFTLTDQSGKTIATRSGTSYILPADTRYVAELGISTSDNNVPTSVNFSISNVTWAKLSNSEKPDFTIFNKKFGPSDTDSSGSSAMGVLRNDSLYDLNSINVVAVLRDGSNSIIGIGTTQLNTVRTKEEREVHFQWPYLSGGDTQSLDIDAQSNVFNKSDFL
jgi:hypothetical protein